MGLTNKEIDGEQQEGMSSFLELGGTRLTKLPGSTSVLDLKVLETSRHPYMSTIAMSLNIPSRRVVSSGKSAKWVLTRTNAN